MSFCPFNKDDCQQDCLFMKDNKCLILEYLLISIRSYKEDPFGYDDVDDYFADDLEDTNTIARQAYKQVLEDFLSKESVEKLANDLVKWAKERSPKGRRIWIPNISRRFWDSMGKRFNAQINRAYEGQEIWEKIVKVEKRAQEIIDGKVLQ